MEFTIQFQQAGIWKNECTVADYPLAVEEANELHHRTGNRQRVIDEAGRVVYYKGYDGEEWAVGAPVKFAVPENDEERDYVMYVMEDNGDRVLVSTPIDGFSPMLNPCSTYRKSDLTPAE